MKILWICNMILPAIAESLNFEMPEGGGWLSGISKQLLKNNDIELYVIFPWNEKQTICGSIGKIHYKSFFEKRLYFYDKTVENAIYTALLDIDPDIVHIFGTEYPHTLAAVNAAKSLGFLDKTVISIQGLVSVYAHHYYAGLPCNAIRRYTIRDFLKHDNIKNQKRKFSKRGKFEIRALESVKHVIGRTEWDKACIKMINPTARYHFCNETLRSSFYDKEWSIDKCEKHSVFVSQSYYPIKGFHQMIEAFILLINKYPDAHIYTTGASPFNKDGVKGMLHRTYYQKFLAKLIRKHHIEDKVTFLGILNEEQMRDRIVRSHVFALTSSIENSPNSLGEAMIMGVPCVASDVGGVKDLLTHNQDGYIYQFDAPYMLANYIDNIFSDDNAANIFSDNAKAHAAVTHSPELNNNKLLEIYRLMLG